MSPELLGEARVLLNLENKLLRYGFKKAGNNLSRWLQGALITAQARQDAKIAVSLTHLARETENHGVIESQNGLYWKGALKAICSNPLL